MGVYDLRKCEEQKAQACKSQAGWPVFLSWVGSQQYLLRELRAYLAQDYGLSNSAISGSGPQLTMQMLLAKLNCLASFLELCGQ